jgi:ribose transport system substrate-binding protein
MTLHTDTPGTAPTSSPPPPTTTTTTTSRTTEPARKPKSRGWVIVLILLAAAIALGVLYSIGALRSRPHVALVTSGEGPYWDLVIAGANEAAKQYDVELTVVRSKSNADTQTQLIRDLLAKNYDGIAISPIESQTEATMLAETASRTTLVTVDSDSPVARRVCFVGTDNYSAGRTLGERVKSLLPEGGDIVICVGRIEKKNTQQRRQGVIDELLERPFDPDHLADPLDAPLKGPHFNVIATLADNADREAAVKLAGEALTKYPNVKCFVGTLSYSAPMVLKALDAAGKTGKVQVIGFDLDDATLEAITAGNIAGTIMQDQFGMGFHTIRILADEARGNHGGLPMFQAYLLPSQLVTKDNLDQVKAQQISKGNASTQRS